MGWSTTAIVNVHISEIMEYVRKPRFLRHVWSLMSSRMIKSQGELRGTFNKELYLGLVLWYVVRIMHY